MKSTMLSLILAMAITLPATALELVTNGDFEQVLGPEWQQSITTPGAIQRAINFDMDEDYEIYAYKGTGNGEVLLSQTTAIPGVDIQFSAEAKFNAVATSTAWAAAALVIGYMDEDGALLGETSICARSYYCPWVSTPTFHLIDAAMGVWDTHGFHIGDELENLPGINPLAVRRLRVTILTHAYDC